jgi:hypothetical protein
MNLGCPILGAHPSFESGHNLHATKMSVVLSRVTA